MISRLTALAVLFAVVTTAALAYAANAANAANASLDQTAAQPAAAKSMPIYQLERVVITGNRVANKN